MLVEDKLAFVEPLETATRDRRAGKRELRVARARARLFEVLCEVRLFEEGLRMHELGLAPREMAPAPGGGRPGRPSAAEREIARVRRHLEKLRQTAAARRARCEALEREAREGGPRRTQVTTYRLHSTRHHVDCSERQFLHLSDAQRAMPVWVTTMNGKRWWWYRDRFWWDDLGLTPLEVKTMVVNGDVGRQRSREALERARADVLGEGRATRPREPIPESVRQEVWRRDDGRCVDCGAPRDLAFDHIIPVSEGGASTTLNVELRCESCASLRRHNEARTSMSRALFDAHAAVDWRAASIR